MSCCDELLGFSEYFVYLVKVLLLVEVNGYCMIGLLYGGSVVGVFIVIVFVCGMLVVLLGVYFEVMDLLLMVCVIKLLIELL